MKRLAWLLLAVFGLALAQVSPVGAVVRSKPKCCCSCGGKCGMPACALPAPAAPAVFDTARSVTVARPQAVREIPATCPVRAKFFAAFAPAKVCPLSLTAPAAVPAASVPRFRAHCSFLL